LTVEFIAIWLLELPMVKAAQALVSKRIELIVTPPPRSRVSVVPPALSKVAVSPAPGTEAGGPAQLSNADQTALSEPSQVASAAGAA